jgi:hypothetical protein
MDLIQSTANTLFGMTAGMKMLACLASSSASLDDTISIGDILEEETLLVARDQSFRPQTLDDSAIGLRQPNGYTLPLTHPTAFLNALVVEV